MRVLHVLRTMAAESGGLVTYAAAASRAAAGTGLRMEGVAVFGREAAPDGLAQPYRAESAGLHAVRGLARWLESRVRDYDVVHLHGVFNWPLFLGATICARSRIPYVVSTHGHVYRWSLAQKPWRKAVYLRLRGRALLEGARALVATTEPEAGRLRELFPGSPVRIIPPGVPVPEGRARVDGPGLQFVFVGRLAPQKGIPVLLRAFAEVARIRADARLTLVGDAAPAYRRELEALAASLGAGQAVHFAGFHDSAARDRVLAQSHAFVLPSYMENFSFATAEALAAGLPVVISREVALAGLVERRNAGWVVGVDDHAGLVAAMLEAGDPVRRDVAAQAARAAAEDELSLPQMGRALERLYAEARA